MNNFIACFIQCKIKRSLPSSNTRGLPCSKFTVHIIPTKDHDNFIHWTYVHRYTIIQCTQRIIAETRGKGMFSSTRNIVEIQILSANRYLNLTKDNAEYAWRKVLSRWRNSCRCTSWSTTKHDRRGTFSFRESHAIFPYRPVPRRDIGIQFCLPALCTRRA